MLETNVYSFVFQHTFNIRKGMLFLLLRILNTFLDPQNNGSPLRKVGRCFVSAQVYTCIYINLLIKCIYFKSDIILGGLVC